MDKMSDETGPALSRRALREARRAQAEAKLAGDAEAGGDAPAAPAPAPENTKPAPRTGAPAAKPAGEPVRKPVQTPPAAAAPKQATPGAMKTEAESMPPRSRRAAAGEVDAVPERAERTSLQRARDREALRTRRRLEQEVSELSPKPVAPAEDPAPLTRKQMRLQALKAAAPTPSAAEGNDAAKSTAAPASKPAAPAQAPAPAAAAKPDAGKSAVAKPAAVKPAADKPVAKPASATPAAAPVPQMSVEDALALRRRSGGGAPSEPLLIAPVEDLAEVDLEVLAQQRELAARAAIISRRAAERLRMQEENTQRAGARRSDPFTGAMNHLVEEDIEKKLVNTGISGPLTRGYNLAMTDQGTIVDGAQDAAASATKTPASAPPAPKPPAPAAKAPAATPAHKPKAATPAPAPTSGTKPPVAKQAAAAAPAKAAAKPAPSGTQGPAASGAGKAEAAPVPADARAGSHDTSISHPPVRAVRAQGLEPLDVQTAGMRRANNMYLMVIAALSVGGAALVAGLIMFLNSI